MNNKQPSLATLNNYESIHHHLLTINQVQDTSSHSLMMAAMIETCEKLLWSNVIRWNNWQQKGYDQYSWWPFNWLRLLPVSTMNRLVSARILTAPKRWFHNWVAELPGVENRPVLMMSAVMRTHPDNWWFTPFRSWSLEPPQAFWRCPPVITNIFTEHWWLWVDC